MVFTKLFVGNFTAKVSTNPAAAGTVLEFVPPWILSAASNVSPHLLDNVPLDMVVLPAVLLVGWSFLFSTATGCFTRAFFSSSTLFMHS